MTDYTKTPTIDELLVELRDFKNLTPRQRGIRIYTLLDRVVELLESMRPTYRDRDRIRFPPEYYEPDEDCA